jgi:hypothetical protein
VSAVSLPSPEYQQIQGFFAHLTAVDIEAVQKKVDEDSI